MKHVLFTFLSLSQLGCDDAAFVDQSLVATARSLPPGPVPVAAAGVVKGYSHDATRSRFRLGGIIGESDEHGMRRTIGDEGVFAVHVFSGEARAIPNANAPGLRIPIHLDAEAHNGAVLEYFIQTGLPREQVRSVHVTVLQQGEDDVVREPGNPAEVQLAAFYSHIDRMIEGIPVVESTAWARLNGLGDVVSEEVRWPEIPMDVVAEARVLQATLTDRDAAQAFRRSLGVDGEGMVTIHHPTWAGGAWFAPFASYDVIEAANARPDITSRVRHFRLDRSELFIPTHASVPSDRKPE